MYIICLPAFFTHLVGRKICRVCIIVYTNGCRVFLLFYFTLNGLDKRLFICLGGIQSPITALTKSSLRLRTAARPDLWGSCRLSVAFSVFLASVQTAMLRDNLGIALLCMSEPTGEDQTCEANDATVPTLPWLTNKKNCEFEWDTTTQGRMLGAFLYGYILTTMVGGHMSNSYGAKIPFMCGGVGNTVFHLLCPMAVLAHRELFFACRFLQGMSAGLMVGPFFQLFSAWSSDEESSSLLTFGFSGFSFGTILAYPMSGQLCGTNVYGFGGWPLVYYVPACISVLFIIFWYRYLYDVPDNHPNISQEEYDYLLENVGISDEPSTIPWKSIFTSMPFISYMVCYSAFLWNIFTMMNSMPMFMRTILNIKPKETGCLFCIPFVLTFMVRVFNGKTYPIIRKHLGLSNTVSRKLYCLIGSLMIVASLTSIIVTHNVTKWHMVAAITANLALGDFAYSGGFFPTLLDIAPNYAGLLSGISTFVAFMAACPATLVNSIVVQKNTKEEWNTVLLIIVIMFAFSMLLYLSFGSASLQKWSVVQPELPEGTTSRSTLLLTRSYRMSRNMSMKHPTHVF